MNLDIQIADSLTEDQVHDLVRLYQSEWWTGGRNEPQIREMLRNGDVIVALSDKQTGRLVGFARVLTDFVYKALIFDVIVDSGYRSKGLGQMLMDHIVNHPNLRSVKHLELYCVSEMVPFYRRWDFTTEIGELQLMRREG
jgi:ribosomal protein S18 acetylase RimI-like enzyme